MGNHHGSGAKRSQPQSQKKQTRAEGRKDVAIDVEFEVSEAGLGFCHHGILRCNCDAVEGTFVVHTEGADSCSEGGVLVRRQGVVELYDDVADEALREGTGTVGSEAVVAHHEAVGEIFAVEGGRVVPLSEAVGEAKVEAEGEAVGGVFVVNVGCVAPRSKVEGDTEVEAEAEAVIGVLAVGADGEVISDGEAVVSHDEAVEAVVTSSEAAASQVEAVGEVGVIMHREAVVSHVDAVVAICEGKGEDSDSSEEECVHRCAFMVQVLPDDQSSGSEVQFCQ